jgi:hypothetical protein
MPNPALGPLRRAADVRYRLLDGEAVVIRQRAGEVLGLNPVGSRLLELIDGARDVEALVDELAAEFAADRGTIARDVEGFLAELVASGVVEPAG